MAFMQKQIQFGKWIVVDTYMGIFSFPAELLPQVEKELEDESKEDISYETRNAILQYTEAYKPEQIDTIEVKTGFGARMSAPGYMDCTEWAVFDTEKEAEQYLEEYYGEDSGDDSDESEEDGD